MIKYWQELGEDIVAIHYIKDKKEKIFCLPFVEHHTERMKFCLSSIQSCRLPPELPAFMLTKQH